MPQAIAQALALCEYSYEVIWTTGPNAPLTMTLRRADQLEEEPMHGGVIPARMASASVSWWRAVNPRILRRRSRAAVEQRDRLRRNH